MRKTLFMLAAVAALGLSVAGCGTIATPGTTPPPSPSVDTTVANVQQTAARICAFVPTVSTVTGIIASFISGGQPINALVTNVAESICAAVVPKRTALRRAVRPSGPPVVAGVPVQGYFLAK